MIEPNNHPSQRELETRVGHLARDLLNQSSQNLSPAISERLALARKAALARKKPEKNLGWITQWSIPGLGGDFSENLSSKLWDTFGAAPIVALFLGLAVIVNWQQDERIRDIAEVDSAILTDVVPPEAYNDDGFIRYLTTGGKDLIDTSVDSDENSNI